MKHVVRQILLKPRTKHDVIVSNRPYAPILIEPRMLSTSRQSTLAAQGMKDVSPNRPSHKILGSFADPTSKTREDHAKSEISKHHMRHRQKRLRHTSIKDPRGKYFSQIRRPGGKVNKQTSYRKKHISTTI